ncbi:hypothetical protein SB00610_05267 [Klebsiella quasipneumoniae subsp. similipneumoniae]|nr:hypothetical protein SB00610_05267 [Klebsiella quasipneumoniae subsp. similipneumoniae]
MGAGHGEKDPRHPRQQLSALLQRLERVGETGRLRIVDNGADLLALLPNALIKRRPIVTVFDQVKPRRLVRQQTDAKKGVLFGHLSLLHRLIL